MKSVNLGLKELQFGDTGSVRCPNSVPQILLPRREAQGFYRGKGREMR